uniref:Putative ovule protein n=1 Tax=Solanum chacoense TaxID=4108 RepID=A0A0V0H3T1_SOLCH
MFILPFLPFTPEKCRHTRRCHGQPISFGNFLVQRKQGKYKTDFMWGNVELIYHSFFCLKLKCLSLEFWRDNNEHVFSSHSLYLLIFPIELCILRSIRKVAWINQ